MTTNGPRPRPEFLDIATGRLYEIYESYVEAGFSWDQALELVKIHLVDYLADTEDTDV